ncbi:MAG: hypothetical protein R6T93_04475 [Trueperaceae bacterium]
MGVFRSRPLAPFRAPSPGWDPNSWASRVPLRKLDNFAEVFRAAWENRDRLGYAWRILNQGTCDGCALGTHGMRDWTVDGIHLCNVRLRLLRLNTLPELDPTRLSDVADLRSLCARATCAHWAGSPSPCCADAAIAASGASAGTRRST